MGSFVESLKIPKGARCNDRCWHGTYYAVCLLCEAELMGRAMRQGIGAVSGFVEKTQDDENDTTQLPGPVRG